MLVLMLMAQGLSTRTTGRSETPSTVAAAAPLAGKRAVFSYADGTLVPRERARGKRIALTFDDGPDPRWTPRIADTLRRLRVPATFFVVGSQAVRYPNIVRKLHREGFELGNHTFTHAELSRLSSWQRSLQIGLTESAVAHITGVRLRLVRPPYSSVAEAVTPEQAAAFRSIARRGYLIVLTDLDGQDWRRRGVGTIVRSITPRRGAGGVVLLHDGGGNRAQTLAALEQAIPRLRARGFRFVSLSSIAGLPRESVEVPAGSFQRVRGQMVIVTLALARFVTAALALILLVVGVLTVVRIAVLLLLARHHASKGRTTSDLTSRPPATVVVPAFNEALGIERTVRALAGSDYPDFEIIIVDDGSTDETSGLVERLGLASVRVVRQPRRGKAAALNRGIAMARHELIVTADADTVFERSTLARLLSVFADPRVGAVSGNTKVGNRRRLIGRWQHIEYVMGFNLDRRLYDLLGCMPTVPGAVGAFRREALQAIGGISEATLAEDTDTTIAVSRIGWRVTYASDARAWTEAPGSLGALWRQRYRWSYGTMQAVWKHRSALWRRGEGRIGRYGLPYLVLFQIALPALAPLVDLFALYGVLFLNPYVVLAYWGGFNFLQLILALYAFRLDGESLRALWAMPLQQFVYRQLMYMVVIESIISALTGARLRWHRVERTGDVEVAASIDDGMKGWPQTHRRGGGNERRSGDGVPRPEGAARQAEPPGAAQRHHGGAV